MKARHWGRTALAILATMAVTACNIQPVQFAGQPGQPRQCSKIMSRVMVDPDPVRPVGPVLTDGPGPASPPPEMRESRIQNPDDPLVKDILNFYPDANIPQPASINVEGKPMSDSWLLLSGGSQNGAFGAGFLSKWAKMRSGGLPRFRVVTGISTGALQSTFVFIDQPAKIVEEYKIPGEWRLLKTFVKPKRTGGPDKLAIARSLANRGALATLAPLRERLHEIITDDVLAAVARHAGTGPRDGRKLLVGAVEMDTGDAYLFDLTKAAQLYVGGNAAMKDCYIEALMASSSVPMAALPVFIEGRMFIDGGARFGVIADFNAELLRDAVEKAAAPISPRHLYVLVNGTLETSRACGLGRCDDERPGPLPPTADTSPISAHGPWTFDKLAERSVSILINQSYRGSVFWARTNGTAEGYDVLFTRIKPGHLDHEANAALKDEPDEKLNCRQWSKRDDEIDRPLEFHPRFMRCLISYGETHPDVAVWAKAE